MGASLSFSRNLQGSHIAVQRRRSLVIRGSTTQTRGLIPREHYTCPYNKIRHLQRFQDFAIWHLPPWFTPIVTIFGVETGFKPGSFGERRNGLFSLTQLVHRAWVSGQIATAQALRS